MPTKSWSNSVGSGSGSTLTLTYDSINVSGGTATLVNPRISFYSKTGWSDSNNTISAAGTAVVDGQVHSGTLNGGTRTWNCTPEAVALAYGQTTTATFNAVVYGISFFNGDQATTTYSWSIDMPARAHELPYAPPAATLTKNTDRSHTISWTTNYTSGTGPRPWRGVYVERWDNVTNAWYRITSLNWDITSYTDTSTVPDRQYTYRVQSYNGTGTSSYTTTTSSWTTPTAHTSLSWAKDGADVVLSWAKASTLNVTTEVEESAGGGAWTPRATVPAGTTSWRHANPSTALTHTYRIRPVINGVPGAWTTSTVVQLQAPPNAPTQLAPAGGAVNTSSGVQLTWRHNPVDGANQTAYQIRHRRQGGAWTTGPQTIASLPLANLSASTYSNGGVPVEWEVRTWAAHADPSPWSATAAFQPSAPPQVTIQTPTDPHPTSSLDIAWTYHDPEATTQAGYRVEVLAGGQIIWSRAASGPATTITPPVTLANETTYQVRVAVQDGHGMWSSTATRTFTTAFLQPPTPLLVVAFDDPTGAATITITNPADPAAAQATHNTLLRSLDAGTTWHTLDELVPLNTTITDPTPHAHGTTLYAAIAWSALPSSAPSAAHQLVTSSCWLYLNGPGTVARMKANPTIDLTAGRAKVLHRFAGRTAPLEYLGDGRTRHYKIDGEVDGYGRHPELGDWQAWETISDQPAPLTWRDTLGRHLPVSISDVTITHDAKHKRATISATLTVVDNPLTPTPFTPAESPPPAGDDLIVVDHGNGTATISGTAVVDHGNGTLTIDHPAVTTSGTNVTITT